MALALVTGARGFVGQALCERLKADGHALRRIVRRNPAEDEVALGDMHATNDLFPHLSGCDWVFHLAARVHVMHDHVLDPLAEFRALNTAATLNLARQAAASGVRRFVYVSSIKVNGESGVFSESDPPQPLDAYGVSKWEAEQGLQAIASQTGMEVVILRPPLVYGPGVKANFLRLMRWIDLGVPLPLGGVQNQRSMIYLGNLVDALLLAAKHPLAAGRCWLVSDHEDVSTPALIRRIAAAMGKRDRLWPVPPSWLLMAGRVMGKGAEVERLTSTLRLDISAIRNELGWVPPFSMAQGLAETAAWYRREHGDRHD